MPYPFIVNSVRATLHRKDRFIDLVLMKALLEPWPCEFQAKHKKFVVDSLEPWEESETNQFSVHLGMQFVLMPQPSQLLTPILDEVREIIKAVIVRATGRPQNFMINIQQKGNEWPDWYLRFHRPLRTSSKGSPVLMLSALDEKLVQSLIKPETQEAYKHVENVGRVFGEYMDGSKLNLTLWFTDPSVIQLWRFLLRLNSTKTIPNSWQKKNLPLGDDSPWLATFISPLYVTNSFDFANLTMASNTDPVEKQNCCAGCRQNTQKPKRCSRCREVLYCSVECQRKHWPQHKIVCTSK